VESQDHLESKDHKELKVFKEQLVILVVLVEQLMLKLIRQQQHIIWHLLLELVHKK
jgi:hypothetical protein